MARDVKGRTSRSYDSPRRRAQADETRRAIVDAAVELFGAHGYAATSLQAIADEAGVSVHTVYAVFETKAGLLAQALDVAIAGDHAPVVVNGRAWMQRVWDAPSGADRLTAYAKAVRRIMEGAGPVFVAVIEAGTVDPGARELAETTESRRRTGAETVIRSVREVARLRAGLDTGGAVDLLWLYNSPTVHRHLVGRCGWSGVRYERWLASVLIEQLLEPA